MGTYQALGDVMDDSKDDAPARRSDPWSSKEVEEIRVHLDLLEAMRGWLKNGTVRACGVACGYSSDFEITAALLPFFPEVYEGMIRRQMRTLREWDPRVKTVPKKEHRHLNPDTRHWQQCHTFRRSKKPVVLGPLKKKMRQAATVSQHVSTETPTEPPRRFRIVRRRSSDG